MRTVPIHLITTKEFEGIYYEAMPMGAANGTSVYRTIYPPILQLFALSRAQVNPQSGMLVREKMMREKYFVVVSVLYVLLGVIIVARAAIAHVMPIVILGIVFLALGLVRLREYMMAHRSRT